MKIDLAKPLSRGIEIRRDSIDEKNHEMTMGISSNRIDSYGSIILQSGIDHEERYRENPVYLWNHPLHDFFGSPGPERVLAKAIGGPIVEGSGEEARTSYRYKFAVKHNKEALLVFNLIKDEYLNASSVGIFARKVVYADSDEEDLDGLEDFARSALVSGKARFIIPKSVLFEASCCYVGANTGALAARGAGDQLRDLLSRFIESGDRLEAAARRLELLAVSDGDPLVASALSQINGDPGLKSLFEAS